jgi:poly(A) polymerase
VLGRAYAHLLEVRLDRGMVGRAAVEQELRDWWARQPESDGS